jgi:hypothetical protein
MACAPPLPPFRRRLFPLLCPPAQDDGWRLSGVCAQPCTGLGGRSGGHSVTDAWPPRGTGARAAARGQAAAARGGEPNGRPAQLTQTRPAQLTQTPRPDCCGQAQQEVAQLSARLGRDADAATEAAGALRDPQALWGCALASMGAEEWGAATTAFLRSALLLGAAPAVEEAQEEKQEEQGRLDDGGRAHQGSRACSAAGLCEPASLPACQPATPRAAAAAASHTLLYDVDDAVHAALHPCTRERTVWASVSRAGGG